MATTEPGPADPVTAGPTDQVIDPDCRDGKHAACVGGPCECSCHGRASTRQAEHAQRVQQIADQWPDLTETQLSRLRQIFQLRPT